MSDSIKAIADKLERVERAGGTWVKVKADNLRYLLQRIKDLEIDVEVLLER